MKRMRECPNCGNAYLIEKELHLGSPGENIGTERMYECSSCKVLFHEEELEGKYH